MITDETLVDINGDIVGHRHTPSRKSCIGADPAILLKEWGYRVLLGDPSIDTNTQKLSSPLPVDGDITAQRQVVNMSPEEVAEKQQADLDKCKSDKLAEIESAFEYEMANGSTDTGFGWPIDARMGMTEKGRYRSDRENMEGLLQVMAATGSTEAEVKGADNNMHIVTYEQVQALPTIIALAGAARWQKKFDLEKQIAAIETSEELTHQQKIDAIDALSWNPTEEV